MIPVARMVPVAHTAPAAPADHTVPLARLARMVPRAIKRCYFCCWVSRHAVATSIRRFCISLASTDRPLTKDN